jgi:hypothetical protein
MVANAENVEAVRHDVCSAVELRSANRTGGPQSEAQRGVGSDKTLNVEGEVGGNATPVDRLTLKPVFINSFS